MKNKLTIILLIISIILFGVSFGGAGYFEAMVNESDGLESRYRYSEDSKDDCLDVSVVMKESWVKKIPDTYVLDPEFEDSKFDKVNDNGEGTCVGRTIEITLNNVSEYRINKWDIEYTAPCDMYIDKAWNGTLEIHQYGGKNIDTIEIKNLPDIETNLNYIEFEELYLVPIKKGDKIIYHPADFEYPLIEKISDNYENSMRVIGIIIYTEDDSFKFDKMDVRYNVVKSLDEYPIYNVLSFGIVLFGVMSLAFAIILIVSVRYDRIHKHDMEIISQAIGTFSKFIDSKDKYTNNHSYRVAGYSKLVAKKMGLSESECEEIYYIGLLHDTGKIAIDSKILNKPGRLTSQEYEIIKSHTTKGADILKDFTAIKDITVGALYHHERYDGKGYPSGKAGAEIPLVARIICVCDAYDAMSSNRCYRAQLDKEVIIEQLEINKGKQFDPEVVDVMLDCIRNGETDSIRRSCIESDQ